ncbi:MAG: TIGR04283 family arsenosugar biosynthesis glycosyltransferase [Bacteroidota bacterium]
MKVSVVIPTLNEADHIISQIEYIKSISKGRDIDIIVVDGGSTDGTVEQLSLYVDVRLVCTSAGRAHQLNVGAQHAQGDWLYFLHADSRPPVSLWAHVLDMDSHSFDSGCFRLRFDDPHPLLRFCSWCTRIDWNGFRYGDQSLLVKKELFERSGGYNASMFLLEDNDMVCRLKRQGRFSLRPAEVLTSARKYRKYGPVYLQSIYCLLYVAYRLGASQAKLVNIYQSLLKRGREHPTKTSAYRYSELKN